MLEPQIPAAPVTPPGTPPPAVPPVTPPATAEPVKAPETPPAAKKAPEKYDLKLSEGSLLDKTHIDKIAEIAKKQGLSNEEAQEMLVRDEGIIVDYTAAQAAQHEKRVSVEWLEEAKKDPEIGGAKFEESVSKAKQAVDRFASPKLKVLLNDSGFGNNPEVIRLFRSIREAFADDKFVKPEGSSPAAPAPKTLAERLYGPK